MIFLKKLKTIKKFGFLLSFLTLMLWSLLGTGASLAWFTDSFAVVANVFHFADFDLTVSHLLPDGRWEKVTDQTKLFDENALYEPGYIQIVYLKIENTGSVDFDYNSSVLVTDYTPGTNVYGQQFRLQDYLRFGVVQSDTLAGLKEQTRHRDAVKNIATLKFLNYTSEDRRLKSGAETFVAFIVTMPDHVDNNANYRDNMIPKVELGVVIKAEQIRE